MAKSAIFKTALIVGLGVFILLLFVALFNKTSSEHPSELSSLNLQLADNPPKKYVHLSDISPDKTDPNCKMYNCFDVYK